jgi:hypothetical protein
MSPRLGGDVINIITGPRKFAHELAINQPASLAEVIGKGGLFDTKALLNYDWIILI